MKDIKSPKSLKSDEEYIKICKQEKIFYIAFKKLKYFLTNCEHFYFPPELASVEYNLDIIIEDIRNNFIEGTYKYEQKFIPVIPFPKFKKGDFRHFVWMSIKDQFAWIIFVMLIGDHFEKQMPDYLYGNRLYKNIWQDDNKKWQEGDVLLTNSKLYNPFNRGFNRFKKDARKKVNFLLGNNRKVYWLRLDFKKFYTAIKKKHILIVINNYFSDNTLINKIATNLLKYKFDYSDINKVLQKSLNNKKIVNFQDGIPTGLAVAGFLQNIFMLKFKKIYRKYSKNVFPYIYCDDHIILSDNIDSLYQFIDEYCNLLNQLEIEISLEKVRPILKWKNQKIRKLNSDLFIKLVNKNVIESKDDENYREFHTYLIEKVSEMAKISMDSLRESEKKHFQKALLELITIKYDEKEIDSRHLNSFVFYRLPKTLTFFQHKQNNNSNKNNFDKIFKVVEKYLFQNPDKIKPYNLFLKLCYKSQYYYDDNKFKQFLEKLETGKLQNINKCFFYLYLATYIFRYKYNIVDNKQKEILKSWCPLIKKILLKENPIKWYCKIIFEYLSIAIDFKNPKKLIHNNRFFNLYLLPLKEIIYQNRINNIRIEIRAMYYYLLFTNNYDFNIEIIRYLIQKRDNLTYKIILSQKYDISTIISNIDINDFLFINNQKIRFYPNKKIKKEIEINLICKILQNKNLNIIKKINFSTNTNKKDIDYLYDTVRKNNYINLFYILNPIDKAMNKYNCRKFRLSTILAIILKLLEKIKSNNEINHFFNIFIKKNFITNMEKTPTKDINKFKDVVFIENNYNDNIFSPNSLKNKDEERKIYQVGLILYLLLINEPLQKINKFYGLYRYQGLKFLLGMLKHTHIKSPKLFNIIEECITYERFFTFNDNYPYRVEPFRKLDKLKNAINSVYEESKSLQIDDNIIREIIKFELDEVTEDRYGK